MLRLEQANVQVLRIEQSRVQALRLGHAWENFFFESTYYLNRDEIMNLRIPIINYKLCITQ